MHKRAKLEKWAQNSLEVMAQYGKYSDFWGQKIKILGTKNEFCKKWIDPYFQIDKIHVLEKILNF